MAKQSNNIHERGEEPKNSKRTETESRILPVLMKPTGFYPDGYQDTKTRNKKQNATSGINLAENLTLEQSQVRVSLRDSPRYC
jgi:hypothetical protein